MAASRRAQPSTGSSTAVDVDDVVDRPRESVQRVDGVPLRGGQQPRREEVRAAVRGGESTQWR